MGSVPAQIRSVFKRKTRDELTRAEVGVLRQTAFHLWLFNVAMGDRKSTRLNSSHR